MFAAVIEHLSRKIWLWTQVRKLAEPWNDLLDSDEPILQFTPELYAKGRDFMLAALLTLRRDAQLFVLNDKTEQQLVTERLARRYDPGLALSESFARASESIAKGQMQQAPSTTPVSADDAIQRHYESMRKKPVELADNQRAALRLQEKTLRKNLDTPKNG